jgi:hypothetical protein
MWKPRDNFMFSEAEYNAAKAADFLPIKCVHCGKEGKARKRSITRVMNGKSPFLALYCSRSCRSLHADRTIKRVTLVCAACGAEFSVFPCRAKGRKRQKYWFCSNACRLQLSSAMMNEINEKRRAEKEWRESGEN